MELNEVVREFLVESYENLNLLDGELVALEKDPHDVETLKNVFRTIHTIKGTAGFLAFGHLEAVTHTGENLLSKLREGVLTLTADITSGLLAMLDAVRGELASIEATTAETGEDHAPLIARLTALAAEAPKPAPAPAPAPVVAAAAAPVAPSPVVQPVSAQAMPAPAPPIAMKPRAKARRKPPVKAEPPVTAAPATSGPRAIEAPVAAPPEPERRAGDDRRTGEERRGGLADTSLRVDVGLLDQLMTLVGELVLARNQILQFTQSQRDPAFLGATQRLNLVTSELQGSVMKTRMQPIDNVWSKFPRVVRDIATQCDKQVRLEMEGKDTELDKTILEAIKDPLTHIVRNSVDHGIEKPSARLERGKPAEGVIRLRAYHEGGQINIEISDDGSGIDPARVKAKAVSKGLLTPDQAARLTDAEAIRLVFIPGFSTADAVSNLSGRGVGMDVVKTNIEKIGGQVDLQSVTGGGTTLKIKIPLTLAIIPALIVTTGGQRFAISQVSLVELVRAEGEQVQTAIERIGDASFYRLRGNLLPLIYLNKALNLDRHAPDDLVNIVVLKADGRQFGLVVDAISDTEEIVVKPLGRQLKDVKVFAGATVMGDGCVALILDVVGLAHEAGLEKVVDRALADAEAMVAAAHGDEERQTLLIFRVGRRRRMAMPLSLVARLEEFPWADVEQAGTREVVQYRGEILPLVSLSDFFGADRPETTQPCQVIVYRDEGWSVGLVVDEISDIVEEGYSVSQPSVQHGLEGSAIIQKQVTDLLDVQAVVGDMPRSLRTGRAA